MMQDTFERPPTAAMIRAARDRLVFACFWAAMFAFLWGVRASSAEYAWLMPFLTGFFSRQAFVRWQELEDVRDRVAAAAREADMHRRQRGEADGH